ncbi:MAG: cupin domain-containing protein [Desulfomonilaceae bacterium]
MGHEILTPSFERTDDRGIFREVLNDGNWEALICGRMNPDAVIGNHYHKKTTIFFYLTSGLARVTTIHVETEDKDAFLLHSGQGVKLNTNESHAIRFIEESDFVMLKSLRYNPADPDTYHFPVKD